MRNNLTAPKIANIPQPGLQPFSYRLLLSRWNAIVLSLWVLMWVFSLTAGASTVTWTNTAGGAWSVPSNWSPNFVPGLSDDAVITSAGTYTITMDVSPTISSLTLGGASGLQTVTNDSKTLTVSHVSVVNANGILGMNSGIVAGSGALAINGLVQWSGGSSAAGFPLTLQVGAVMNLQNTIVFQGAVTNFGTVNWLGGGVAINTNSGTFGVFLNQPGAVFDIQCSQSFYFGISVPTFYNAGLIRKEIDAGATIFGAFISNTGTVQATAGTINFSNGSNLGGIFQADNGANINFNGSNFTLSSPPTNFQGPGTVQFTTVNLTLSNFTGSYTINGQSLLVGQNTVSATGIVTLKGCNLDTDWILDRNFQWRCEPAGDNRFSRAGDEFRDHELD